MYLFSYCRLIDIIGNRRYPWKSVILHNDFIAFKDDNEDCQLMQTRVSSVSSFI
jgi:hypothetical protein